MEPLVILPPFITEIIVYVIPRTLEKWTEHFGQIFIGMKQKKWPIKKTEIFNSLNIFSQKFIWAKLIFIDPSDIL